MVGQLDAREVLVLLVLFVVYALFIPTEVVISSAIPISGTIPICSSTIPVSYWLSLLLNAFECFMLPFILLAAAVGGEGEEEEE